MLLRLLDYEKGASKCVWVQVFVSSSPERRKRDGKDPNLLAKCVGSSPLLVGVCVCGELCNFKAQQPSENFWQPSHLSPLFSPRLFFPISEMYVVSKKEVAREGFIHLV